MSVVSSTPMISDSEAFFSVFGGGSDGLSVSAHTANVVIDFVRCFPITPSGKERLANFSGFCDRASNFADVCGFFPDCIDLTRSAEMFFSDAESRKAKKPRGILFAETIQNGCYVTEDVISGLHLMESFKAVNLESSVGAMAVAGHSVYIVDNVLEAAFQGNKARCYIKKGQGVKSARKKAKYSTLFKESVYKLVGAICQIVYHVIQFVAFVLTGVVARVPATEPVMLVISLVGLISRVSGRFFQLKNASRERCKVAGSFSYQRV